MGQIHNIYVQYIYIYTSPDLSFCQNAAKERKTTEEICETTANAILLCTNFHKGSQLPEESLRDGFRVPFPSVPPTWRHVPGSSMVSSFDIGETGSKCPKTSP